MRIKTCLMVAALALAIPTNAQDSETQDDGAQNTPDLEEQLSLTPHPLRECIGEKRRRLACDEMRTKGGFIVTTHLRDGRRTIQYQISAFSSVRRNPHFMDGYEDRVREHFRQAVPIAAEIMGWEQDAPETLAMIEDAYTALDRLEISLEEKPRSESGSVLDRTGLERQDFSAGRFYSNRSVISNSYSLYLWKPGFTKD